MFTRKKLILLVLLIVFVSGVVLLAHITDIDLKRLSFGKKSLSSETVEENFAKHGLKGRVKSIRTLFYYAKKDAYQRTVRAGVKGGEETPDYLYRSFTREGLLKDSILFINKQYRVYVTYKYNSRQLPIEIIQMDREGNFFEKKTLNYDKNGNKIKETYIYKSLPTRVYIYEYDKNGREIKRTFLGDETIPPSITKNSYNTRGQLVNTTFSYNKDTIEYRFNSTENVEEKFRHSNGKTEFLGTKKYDKKGQVVEETFDSSTNLFYSKFINSYDENGNLLRKARVLLNGTYEFDNRYTYDENNRMIKIAEGKPIDGELQYMTTTYRYFLDRNGNVREKYEYYEDIPMQISVSRIEYY